MKIANALLFAGSALAVSLMAGCKANGDNPGLEYAPQMYHSVAYEPLTQIKDESQGSWLSNREDGKGEFFNSNVYNPHGMNMREPVENTVPRNKQGYLPHRLKQFELEQAALIKNPVATSDQVLKDGEKLYLQYCNACHGKGGEGDGKAGEVIGGVANLKGGAYVNLPEGHIFHVITKGKGRMGAHGSQIPAESRWKIVHYVKQVIQGQAVTAESAPVADSTAVAQVTPAN
ncbi:MAG: c-type cytochrome [Algoriphagus aquaeductus]|uniref:Quinol:cytochrome c oxidoreductase monoheme cytochrome subunit n=1 Tax=Algoriphagus aquaeductus TaxID=475299 RepID=A0A326RTW3_9BACT|nr:MULTISPECIES: cytochrome c [Algoriphagus]PZV85279.1 quinol:cytochrome c oxidoreductase monoheme cytochrome subunit [Algoriphagus aquaeductus]